MKDLLLLRDTTLILSLLRLWRFVMPRILPPIKNRPRINTGNEFAKVFGIGEEIISL
jgi:hypothetical protein